MAAPVAVGIGLEVAHGSLAAAGEVVSLHSWRHDCGDTRRTHHTGAGEGPGPFDRAGAALSHLQPRHGPQPLHPDVRQGQSPRRRSSPQQATVAAIGRQWRRSQHLLRHERGNRRSLARRTFTRLSAALTTALAQLLRATCGGQRLVRAAAALVPFATGLLVPSCRSRGGWWWAVCCFQLFAALVAI